MGLDVLASPQLRAPAFAGTGSIYEARSDRSIARTLRRARGHLGHLCEWPGSPIADRAS
jgi:hypothetical protein